MRISWSWRGLINCGLPVAALGLPGCAIHPLPEDVAALNTVEIVEHIRCETYSALRHQIVIAFEGSQRPEAREIGRMIKDDPSLPLEKFRNKTTLLDPVYQKRIAAFRTTTVGYGFRFNITEQDVARSELNFGLPWNSLSNFTLKAAGGVDKKRANTRRFFKVDTFEELLLSKDCLNKTLNAANFAYPITGTIGLKGVVDDFVKLTTRGARSEGDSKDVKNFSEQLTFTTEISGSITPKVKVAPVTDRFKLADASGELSAKRTDVHELTLTFAIGKDFDLAAVAKRSDNGRQAVINELNSLRILDAVERGGAIAVP